MWDYGYGYAGLGMLAMALFWGALIWAIVRSGGAPRATTNERFDAVQVLETRFARGEIDVDEFEHRRRRLSN